MKGERDTDFPKVELTLDMRGRFLFHKEEVVGFSVKAVITDHIKISVGDMNNDFFDKLEDGDSFLDVFIILVAVVTKGDEAVFIREYSFLGDDGPADITDHIVDDVLVIGEFGVSINVKAVVFGFVELVDKRIKARGIDSVFQIKKQSGHESFSEHTERNEVEFLKRDAVADGAE